MEGAEDPRITALLQRLNGTRQSADTTITTYVASAKKFLLWLGDQPFNSDSVDKYFKYRRNNNISVRTQLKEFYNLMYLFRANNVDWKFTKYDTPRATDEPDQPAFMPAQIDQIILAAQRFSPAERLYLAICTTWSCRREAMCQIGKRQWNENENTLIIPGVKHDRTIKHLIPQILRPLFSDYRLKEHKAVAMSQIFHRIIEKSELQLEAGYGWNSFRRTITTMAEKLFLPKNDIPASLWSDYTGWAKRTAGEKFFNSAMAGYYSHTEILDQDPYWIDKQIYAVHPFLKTWSTVLSLPRLTDTITQDDETITEEDYTKLPADDTPAVELSPLEKLLQDLKNEKPYEKT